MQKSTITFEGVDYVVRTLDITSLPTFEGEAYKAVTVADYALWAAIEPAYELCDKWAICLDEDIFYYADSDFIKADPTDEQLLDYLREHLCGMTHFTPVSQPKTLDFYSIEDDGSGGKMIQLLGYTYHGDNWKTIVARGVALPLSEFVDGMDDSEDYVNSLYEASREYEQDVTDDCCVAAINHWFDGEPADYYLDFADVTIDTPVGNYVNESK